MFSNIEAALFFCFLSVSITFKAQKKASCCECKHEPSAVDHCAFISLPQALKGVSTNSSNSIHHHHLSSARQALYWTSVCRSVCEPHGLSGLSDWVTLEVVIGERRVTLPHKPLCVSLSECPCVRILETKFSPHHLCSWLKMSVQ